MVAGRYRLRSVLGSGSMGTVWSAYDEFLHRPVAVKEMKLPPGVPASQADELRERTLREARAIAVLSHPNVIILHDVARDNDEPFVVMELLPSRSLAHILRDHGPLNVEQAAAVGIAVAAALEAAHDAGITHRDVKPGNVLVAGDGRIKLTDFGIARNVSEATMTRTGIMLGSPAYIAPEVASGGAVTPAADLWGLGATLFAAVEGAPPYDADGDPLETVGKVVNGSVPKPKPGPLADVIAALMKKEPEKRISLREVRHRLYPLQGKTALDLFGPELFRTPDGKKTSAQLDATDTQVLETVAPTDKKSEASGALAADPGPLPFLRQGAAPAPVVAAPVASASRRRSPRASALLAVAAVVLFLVAGIGGFALARLISGQSLIPPAGSATSAGAPGATVPPPQDVNLVQQRGHASETANSTRDTEYVISVPEGWQRFIAGRSSNSVGASTVVQYVSPDGHQSLRIERFPNFLKKHDVADYEGSLRASADPGGFAFAKVPVQTDAGTEMIYRTVEHGDSAQRGPDSSITRTTFALLKTSGESLWAVSLTVPPEIEPDGAETWDRIKQTLSFPGDQ
ncbi:MULTISPECIES: serine/threonine-protein kinase [unclassified Amycolatopsis]|uniref:serine/threonine-protein kinase n=1 Tax=unclassified Amycolatopsis TaxID=2618356 RepID=UPI001C69A699|nr:serine/threonine-protein kinase [Amycolatopsis sp. DSM 110486]QYN26134.1 serine/threonine protein kinase [Amycolatopsis sp. DSM 110486]